VSSLVEQIKTRVSIVDVVASYVKLDTHGTTAKGRCPFHNEKTPSFFVSPVRGSFYCFGCNKGGDIFTFIEEIEGVDFKGALQTLATRAGLQVEDFRVSREEQDEKAKLRQVLTTATAFFEAKLGDYPVAAEYVRGRGITDETRAAFRIGYAPDGWRGLYDFLKSRTFTDQEIERAGMTIKSERGYYDRFRNRIMFPIADASGSVVAFSGRILPGPSQASTKEPAKYINSPETPLYSKSQVLYGYDKAKQSIRKADAAILVEGQMDLVLSHQAGVTHAVAVSGTALTPIHLQLLSRLSNNVVMAFDQDVAGFNAARRAIEMALTQGMDVRLCLVPHAKDPADLVRENPQLWRDTVGTAHPVIDALLHTITARGLLGHERRRVVETEVVPYVARLASKLDQAHYVQHVAEFLGIKEDPVWDAVHSLVLPASARAPLVQERAAEPVPKWRRIAERLTNILDWQKEQSPPLVATEALERSLLDALGDVRWHELHRDEDGKLARIFAAELSYQGHSNLERECALLRHALKEELLKERFEDSMRRLREAERTKHQGEVEQYMQECHTISQELRLLSAEQI